MNDENWEKNLQLIENLCLNVLRCHKQYWSDRHEQLFYHSILSKSLFIVLNLPWFWQYSSFYRGTDLQICHFFTSRLIPWPSYTRRSANSGERA